MDRSGRSSLVPPWLRDCLFVALWWRDECPEDTINGFLELLNDTHGSSPPLRVAVPFLACLMFETWRGASQGDREQQISLTEQQIRLTRPPAQLLRFKPPERVVAYCGPGRSADLLHDEMLAIRRSRRIEPIALLLSDALSEDGTRSDLQELMNLVQSGTIDAVLVVGLKDLGPELADVLGHFARYRVSLWTIEEQLQIVSSEDTDSAASAGYGDH